MLEQTTNLGKPRPKEFHAVVDEHSPMADTLGPVLGVFPTAAKARRFAANVKEAARIARAGSTIKWAFHPGVNTEALQRITSASPQVRPRIVQIIEDLPVGAHVHPRLHLATSGHPPGSLRCL
jgi:hypothetical protein